MIRALTTENSKIGDLINPIRFSYPNRPDAWAQHDGPSGGEGEPYVLYNLCCSSFEPQIVTKMAKKFTYIMFINTK